MFLLVFLNIKTIFSMCCRARTPKNFQVRANMMIKKQSVKKFVATTKSNNPHFFHICCFLLLFVAATKKRLLKCCPTIKKTFLFKNFSKQVFLMSLNTKKGPSLQGMANLVTTYVFASYTPLFKKWTIFWNMKDENVIYEEELYHFVSLPVHTKKEKTM